AAGVESDAAVLVVGVVAEAPVAPRAIDLGGERFRAAARVSGATAEDRRLLPAAHELHHFTDQARVEKRIEHRKQKFLFIPSHGISLWLNESSSQNDGMGWERTWRTSFATGAR